VHEIIKKVDNQVDKHNMQFDTHVENQLRIDGHHWSRIEWELLLLTVFDTRDIEFS